MEDIIGIALKFGEDEAHKHAADWYKEKLKQEEEQKKIEAAREDYKEEPDENGRIWYHRTHLFHQRPTSRKLGKGDIIQYTTGKGYGCMIVNSFDYESDFAARAFYSLEVWDGVEDNNKTYISYGGGGAPGIDSFTLATNDEIKNFFRTIKKHKPKEFDFYFNKIVPDYVKDLYGEYI